MSCDAPGRVYAADFDGSIFVTCDICRFDIELGSHPTVPEIIAAEKQHHGEVDD